MIGNVLGELCNRFMGLNFMLIIAQTKDSKSTKILLKQLIEGAELIRHI